MTVTHEITQRPHEPPHDGTHTPSASRQRRPCELPPREAAEPPGGRATVHDSGGGNRFFAGVLPRPRLRAVTKRRRIDPGRLATVAKHVPPVSYSPSG